MIFDIASRSEEHTSELQSHSDLVCRLLLEKKKSETQRSPSSRASHLTASRNASFGRRLFFFFFNDTATTEFYTLSLHDALPISQVGGNRLDRPATWRRHSPHRRGVRPLV